MIEDNLYPQPNWIKPLRFTEREAYDAGDMWGMNCGPSALAAIMQLTLDEIRPHMGDFEAKRYTNPTLMLSALGSLNAKYLVKRECLDFPAYGLARIQWEGPWTKPGVPIAARYRHTHWVASRWNNLDIWIFDINAISAGGWVPERTWNDSVVPWILGQCEPKADGKWHITHSIEIQQ